jgi:hypothetical protein
MASSGSVYVDETETARYDSARAKIEGDQGGVRIQEMSALY